MAAANEEQLSERNLESGKEVTLQWKVSLPKDERDLIQVIAATDARTAAFSDVLIERPQSPPAEPPKLYLVVLGVNQYADPKIPPLGFSVADAEAVAEELRTATQGVYTIEQSVVLTNEKVTPQNWHQAIEQLKSQLPGVAKPDDLAVFFLAGHGIVDEQTRKYYFVGHDFKLSDLEARQYSACIGCEDFRALRRDPLPQAGDSRHML